MTVDVYIVGGYAFVQHPAARGVWLRTHPSVAKIACSFCGSDVGVPCINKKFGKFVAYTHFVRRQEARRLPIGAHEKRITIVEGK